MLLVGIQRDGLGRRYSRTRRTRTTGGSCVARMSADTGDRSRKGIRAQKKGPVTTPAPTKQTNTTEETATKIQRKDSTMRRLGYKVSKVWDMHHDDYCRLPVGWRTRAVRLGTPEATKSPRRSNPLPCMDHLQANHIPQGSVGYRISVQVNIGYSRLLRKSMRLPT